MPNSIGRIDLLIVYSTLADNIDIMSYVNIKSWFLNSIGLFLLIFGCQAARSPELVANSAIVDSLISVIDQATTAVADRRYPDFLELIDPHDLFLP